MQPEECSGRRRCRCRTRELRLCDTDRREWFCDFQDRRRSLWLLLPSPENSTVTNAGVRSLLSLEVAAGLPPNRFRDRRCSVQPFLLRFDNVAMVIVNVAVS
ncbi:uncharacterized protein [Arachis hypogaea]|uniref:uncharacterized protein n=1 Tax=Arachis hypogaea TaxID=3818 RepID=UPI000DEC5DCA|nr:uncharacterized protein LOC112748249 [Arachis hypogaea]QHO11710.1 uncharacterized protein DS421_15g500520 [Arachis hypogaea]